MRHLKNILSLLLKKEKQEMLQLIILDVIVSILDIAFLILLLLVIDSYTHPTKSTYINSQVVDALKKNPLLFIGMFCLFFGLKNWFGFFVSKKQFQFNYHVALRMSEKRLSDYLDGKYIHYASLDSSIHTGAINHDPVDFAHYVLRQTQQIISQSILILITLIPIVIFKPVLFSLLLLILVPPVFLLAFFMKKRLQAIQLSAKSNHGKLIQYLKEAIAGFVESKIYHGKDFFQKRFTDRQAIQMKGMAEQQILQSIPTRLIEAFAIFGLFILVMINFYTQGDTIEFITIGAFMAGAYKIIPGIVKILNSAGQIKAFWFTVNNLLAANTPEKITPVNEPVNSVEFKDVSFGYDNEKLIDRLSFILGKGDMIGICGGSGKGKTTMLNIMIGFLSPSSGSVLVNNTGTAGGLQPYLKNIAYVKQQPFFIHDTIAKNIVLSEEFDKQRLHDAVTSAGIGQILEKHVEGVDTVITENGRNLSGGQRQRIAFARSLYKTADILLFDEPFSELDTASEQSLLQCLKDLSKQGKMIMLVTHNRESLSFCNKIIDLDAR